LDKPLVTPVKVGLLVVVGAAALFVFLSFVGGSVAGRSANEYYAVFDDGTGLAPMTQVRVAGIPVGEVTRIELVEGKARVWFKLRSDIVLYPDAVISKRSESLLGDFLLDLDPGSPSSGSAVPPGGSSTSGSRDRPAGFFVVGVARAQAGAGGGRLPPGSAVPNVRESVQMEQLFESMSRITKDIEVITGALRETIAGDQASIERIVQNLERLSENLNRTMTVSSDRLDRILANAESVSRDVRAITAGKQDDINDIVTNVKTITEQTRQVMNSVQGIVGSNESDLKETVGSLRDALATLNRSLQNVEAVTTRMEKGEGLIGKLASDKEFADKVETGVTDASDFLSRVVRLQAEITLRSEILANEAATKNYVRLRLIPRPDKYYEFEVVDDPRGVLTRDVIVRSPPGSTEVANQEVRTTSFDRLKFSAQFAKRYAFLTLRFGLIESTGGLGFNLHFLDDHLEIKTDAYEWSNPAKDYPRIKSYLNVYFLKHLFVTGGADDLLNPPQIEEPTGRILSGRDYFLGGGIYFTDDDIKSIIGSVPAVSP
jgi:phospholipid/cholesterol/gamma-HCH transport system substrate-binding protein